MKTFGWLLLFGAISVGGLSTVALAQSAPEAEEKTAPEAEELEVVDLTVVTCKDLLRADGEERDNLLVFMHGYMNGKAGDATINAPVLAEATDKIIDTCISTPDKTLITAFEESRQ